MMENELMNFVENFFKNLGANIEFKEEILTVTKVPMNFQKFYGKNEPYKFSLKNVSDSDIEFLEKGCYTLKVISNYLENSGQTTLLKINFQNISEDELKKNFKIKNARIIKLSLKKKFDFFFRFTFHTSFQYLNEREKLINEIYVHNNKVIEGDLNDYSVIEGQTNEVKIPDMKEPYFLAKEELKKKISDKTNEIVTKLNALLDIEAKRIENHFLNQEQEVNKSLKKIEDKLNREKDEEKLIRDKKLIESMKEKFDSNEMKQEKERTILIEKNRHSLNVNNKLFNTTLIYHPLFAYDVLVENSDMKKTIEITYNPLTQSLNPIHCDVCKSNINEIYVCKNGHIGCTNCVFPCGNCNVEFCKNCLTTVCSVCKKNICSNCVARCFSCGELMCKKHTKFDKFSEKFYCHKCLLRCERCGELKTKESFKLSLKTNAKICEDCFRKEVQVKTLRGIFK